MLLCKNRRLFTVAGDNSHVLTPMHFHALNSHSHPIPIPWLILLPFPWESHGTRGIPVFPIPMHTSSHSDTDPARGYCVIRLTTDRRTDPAGTEDTGVVNS